jgi:hypothetical protein
MRRHATALTLRNGRLAEQLELAQVHRVDVRDQAPVREFLRDATLHEVVADVPDGLAVRAPVVVPEQVVERGDRVALERIGVGVQLPDGLCCFAVRALDDARDRLPGLGHRARLARPAQRADVGDEGGVVR